MPPKAASTTDIQHAARAIRSASETVIERGSALASDALPRLADAAQRTSRGVADLAVAAGEAIAAQLRKQDKDSVAKIGATLATTGVLGSVVRFAMRRPILALVGGIAVAQVGLAIWRRQQAQEAIPATAAARAA